MNRLDLYETLPSGMKEYLSSYGWHFSKRMCEWAVSMMKGSHSEGYEPIDREYLNELKEKYGIEYQAYGYDDVYAGCQAKADYFGSSLTNEWQLIKFVADQFEDADGYDGMIFTRWYADTIAKGIPIIWQDMM